MSSPAPRIYLDHAATTPLDPRVLAAMLPLLQAQFGNPSSLHHWGRQARKALENARAAVAETLQAQPEEIIFTSGATEANNLAVMGVAQALAAKGKHLITTAIEHAAVAAPMAELARQGWDVTWLPVDAEGFVRERDLEAALRPDTALVSMIHGNNEVGTIQPIEAFGTLLRARDVPFHVDAVQTAGKWPLNLSALPVDYLSLSAHKFYGPKGVGALYVRSGAPVPAPLTLGGGQEGDRRSGTENLPGIVGLAEALRLSTAAIPVEMPRLRALQARLMTGVLAAAPMAMLNGPQALHQRVPGNVHFSFPPAEGEALVLQLDLKGIAVSSGSACHSAVIEPSRVVLALGKPAAVARATVRFSLGQANTEADVDRVIAVLPGILARFQT